MGKNEQTIAEQALAAAEVVEETEGTSAPTPTPEKPVKPTTNSKYKAGVYRSDKFLRIIRQLSVRHQKDANGQVQKTYGTWTGLDNMIIFQKGVEKRLTAEDVALVSIQRLIDSKVIYRVGD